MSVVAGIYSPSARARRISPPSGANFRRPRLCEVWTTIGGVPTMDAVTATVQMTAKQFLGIPEDSTARRWELIDGELVVSEASRMHNGSQTCVLVALREWVRGAAGRGWVGLPLDVLIDDRNVYAPDVVWYREGRAPGREDPAPYAVPDLVVEVRSPSTWRYDIGRKKQQYERHGVGELWLRGTAANAGSCYPPPPRPHPALR